MNIWSCKWAGHAPNPKDVTGFELCLATFKDAADTWAFDAIASVERKTPDDSTSLSQNIKKRPLFRQLLLRGARTMLYHGLPFFKGFNHLVTKRSPLGLGHVLMKSYLLVEQSPGRYTATQLAAGLPLGWTNGTYPVFPYSPQLPSLSMASGLSGELGNSTINMWTSAPLGFRYDVPLYQCCFSEWDTYVANMVPGTNGHP
ncbi:hypothetical protein IW261DRAFT_1426374 [Armillaria novae-zelandiae]|uniref:Uncharacterized protein n=1 Tax=Armillaria novae-zelandiae TaxID=153914 RepID=A0AA39T6T6_9AGAR|nr:hypothetical protein IW261DRAFT_1426374 [Armillaria novae-zelandiae]